MYNIATTAATIIRILTTYGKKTGPLIINAHLTAHEALIMIRGSGHYSTDKVP